VHALLIPYSNLKALQSCALLLVLSISYAVQVHHFPGCCSAPARLAFATCRYKGFGVGCFKCDLPICYVYWGGISDTFVLHAAEVYPSNVRSRAHGVSAAIGKLGALTPTILFNYISDRTKFWFVCWAGLVGFVVTLVLVPDATGELACSITALSDTVPQPLITTGVLSSQSATIASCLCDICTLNKPM